MSAISAIVPTYNRSAFLSDAVSAILAQTHPVDEIVVWDDGSTDETEEVACGLVESSGGRVRYLKSRNHGKAHALNAALAQTSGDLVWICDDDDIALPDAADHLARALESGEMALAAGKHLRFRQDPQTGERIFFGTGYWPDLTQGSVLRHLLEDIFFFQNATLVRRDALDQVGPFREELPRSIDYDMFVRLASRYPVTHIDKVLFHQRKHDGVRGPAAQRHSATDSEAVWRDTDKAIFTGLRDVLPLSLYEAMYSTDDPRLLHRAALLQRACVYARRTDWDNAMEDFDAATAIIEPGPLRKIEERIVGRSMCGKHGCEDVFGKSMVTRISGLAKRTEIGKQIASALAVGGRWRIREAITRRDPSGCAHAAAFVLRNLSPFGSASAIAGGDGPDLFERNELPRDAYAW